MQEKGHFFFPFSMQKKEKSASTLQTQVFRSKVVLESLPHPTPTPSFRNSSSGFGALDPALPQETIRIISNWVEGNGISNEKMNKGGSEGMPQGLAPAFTTLSLFIRRLQVLRRVEVAGKEAASASSPRGRPRPPARAGPLRATPAELQFDISRPAWARLEPEHVPGCFIAAAAAAGPGGCVCACARPGGREAGGGGGRRRAGAGSWSPGEAKKVNSSCCARAWENSAPCAWPGLIGARCVWGVCVCPGPPPPAPPGQESEGAAGWEPSPGAYPLSPPPPPQAKVSSSGRGAHTRVGEWGILPPPAAPPSLSGLGFSLG